jgi:hypothetical protein
MAKLTPQAEEFWSGKKEDEMVVKKDEVMIGELLPQVKVVEAAPVPSDCCEMVVDSPKKLWDAIGHIQFKHTVTDWEDAMNYMDQVVGFWAAVEEHFAPLFEVADKASPAQLNLLKRLFGDKYSEDFANLSKEEASAKIDEQMKATGSGSSTSAPAKSSGYDWKAKKAPASAPAGKPDGNPASEKQLGFMETLARRLKVSLPEDYKLFSSPEASAWIKAHTEQK